jgi:pSer/pThr/pTyr-binding forkhead associated (FHA) protein
MVCLSAAPANAMQHDAITANPLDIGSLNGTDVNGQPIDSALLTNGDEIQMGKFRLVLLIQPATG